MTGIVKPFFVPSNLIVIISLFGMVLLLFKRTRRMAAGFLSAGLILYFFFGTGVVSLWLLGTLETRYPQIKEDKALRVVNEIVVLTGYAETNPVIPPSSEVNCASAFRLLETRRVFHFLPGAKVWITGSGDVPIIMGRLLTSLGVSESRIFVENQSSNTFESAVNVQKLIQDKPFILITSAGHMPRAMGAFRKLGMSPIPAPTNFMSVKEYQLSHFFPSPLHLSYSDLAVHEYLGIAWYWLTDRL